MGIGIFEEQEMNLYGAGQRQTRQIIRKKDTKTYPKRPKQPCNKTHRRHIAKRRDERMYRRTCFHQPLYLSTPAQVAPVYHRPPDRLQPAASQWHSPTADVALAPVHSQVHFRPHVVADVCAVLP